MAATAVSANHLLLPPFSCLLATTDTTSLSRHFLHFAYDVAQEQLHGFSADGAKQALLGAEHFLSTDKAGFVPENYASQARQHMIETVSILAGRSAKPICRLLYPGIGLRAPFRPYAKLYTLASPVALQCRAKR